MGELVTLNLKLPRNTEVTPEAAKTFLSALTQINPSSSLDRLLGKGAKNMALEIALINQQIFFLITCDSELVPFIETQIQSNYPLAIIEKIKDPLQGANDLEYFKIYLAKGSFYPIATYDSFTDIDPLSSILSVLAKSDPDEIALVQIALSTANASWQARGKLFADQGTKNADGTYSARADSKIITEKISYPGFLTTVRIISNTNKTLTELSNAIGVFTKSDGNSLTAKKPSTFPFGKNLKVVKERAVNDKQIFNVKEIATLWHLPNEKIKVPSIVWGTSVLSEPPITLPIAEGLSDEERLTVNFFAKTLFKNKESIFGKKN